MADVREDDDNFALSLNLKATAGQRIATSCPKESINLARSTHVTLHTARWLGNPAYSRKPLQPVSIKLRESFVSAVPVQ